MATWKKVLTENNTATLTNKTIDFNATGNTISNIDIANFNAGAYITESEGIGSNDNDLTLPTSAAVKDYVDTNVTAQDLDGTTDSGAFTVDLDSQTLTLAGGTNLNSSGTGQTATVNMDSSISLTQVTTSTSVRTPAIQFTDGDAAITIADGGAVTTAGALTVTGNLIVSGTTTTINTATVDVEDVNIRLGNVASPTTTTGDGAGIEVETQVLNSVRSIGVTDGGSGYTSGAIVVSDHKGGSGLTGTFTAVGGEITAVTVTAGGSGYDPDDLPVIDGDAGGGGDAVLAAVLVSITALPALTWTKDLGGQNTDGSGTANDLTGWKLSNSRTSNDASHAVAVMDFGTSAASGNSAGRGSFHLDTSSQQLYIRTS